MPSKYLISRNVARIITLTPVWEDFYYISSSVKKVFFAGKDFTLWSVFYPPAKCSIRDFEPGSSVEILYNERKCRTYIIVPG
jgi:hypothetical protein